MTINLPNRPDTHNLEEESKRYFNSHLPTNWTSENFLPDYGVDLRVEIFDENIATSLEILVQLKASAQSSSGETETITLKMTTYNYLLDKLQVVMLVKFIQEENKAYWLLLKDVPKPNQENRTMTVPIPKSNLLSSIDWNEVLSYVRKVSNKKLSAWRSRNKDTK